ncbi:hypothetical protein C8J57DRAFT_1218782 [Mycena rebaudengoi]|nr:hypothetical protein C8J57DRAFT_1218782 [Mycena rebaudengoi]
MFFTAYLVSAALLMSAVSALPQVEGNVLEARGGGCSPGSYRLNGVCITCPAGNTCDGNGGPAKCDMGHSALAGSSGECDFCTPGYYQDKRGQESCLPCPAGSYAPNYASSYCNKAPSGWFQNYTGMAFKCGTCCGWEAKANGNLVASNCTNTAKPNADINSGDGCKATSANCVRAASCTQNLDGSCPDGSPTSYQI